MAINMMCTNSQCVNYWEDNCMKNINEERIEINEYGLCETFQPGISPMYAGQEVMDGESANTMATLGVIDGGRPQEDRDTGLEYEHTGSGCSTCSQEVCKRDHEAYVADGN
jgi:hypothetical protein